MASDQVFRPNEEQLELLKRWYAPDVTEPVNQSKTNAFGLTAEDLATAEPAPSVDNDIDTEPQPLTADDLEEIRQVQPQGPYLLGGYSGGGITAYEMGQQLQAAGEDVAMIAMIDTPLPMRPALNRQDKALIKMHEFRRKGPGFITEWATRRIRWEFEKRRSQPAAPGVAEFDNSRMEQAFRTGLEAYETKPWNGPLALFRPPLDRHWKVSGGNWVSAEREYVFEDNDWRKWAPELQVVEVPGDHDSMVLVPNAAVLAEHLKAVKRSLHSLRMQEG